MSDQEIDSTATIQQEPSKSTQQEGVYKNAIFKENSQDSSGVVATVGT